MQPAKPALIRLFEMHKCTESVTKGSYSGFSFLQFTQDLPPPNPGSALSHVSFCMQNGMNGMQEVITCNVSSSSGDQSSACGSGYVCAPLPSADIHAAGNAAQSAAAWGLAPAANPMQGVCPAHALSLFKKYCG